MRVCAESRSLETDASSCEHGNQILKRQNLYRLAELYNASDFPVIMKVKSFKLH
jgi:hypothetical protein